MRPLRTAGRASSGTRRGLTLIELLVTITIMVVVLGAVIPLMSPNNNARKIREAGRQLNSLFQQAKAQAARDNRPVGVSFVEFDASQPGPYSGMALQAFLSAEPPPFTGFSNDARVTVGPAVGGPAVYGDVSGGNGGTLYPRYNGEPLYQLAFVLAGPVTPPPPDVMPPGMLRFGDIIEVDHREYMIVDDEKAGEAPNIVEVDNGSAYLEQTDVVVCVWINRSPSDPGPTAGKTYEIRRVPTSTSDQPMSFPRGIGIDLQASSAAGVDGVASFDGGGANRVDIMFKPNGTLEAVYVDHVRKERIDQVYILLGLFENGNDGTQEFMDYNFYPSDNGGAITDDTLTQRRGRINWLNRDSRWVAVNRSGRVVVAQNNTSFDPRHDAFVEDLQGRDERERADEQRARHLNGTSFMGTSYPGARMFAQQMQSEGGR